MSEHDERGPSELEGRLDAAFRETRPRRGFEDELWARLRARRPWWQRLGDSLDHIRWRGVATGLAALLLVGLLVTVVRLAGVHGGGAASTGTSSPLSYDGGSQAPPKASGVSRAATAGELALPFGRLAAPAAAGVPQVIWPPGPSALAAGAQGVSVQGAILLPEPPGLAVYRYDPAAGPPDGTILEANAVPAALTTATGVYPSRQAAEAIAAAGAGSASSEAVVLTRVRLVYVAVVSGGRGYLEPAYLFTGTAGSGTGTVAVQVLVSALAPSALR